MVYPCQGVLCSQEKLQGNSLNNNMERCSKDVNSGGKAQNTVWQCSHLRVQKKETKCVHCSYLYLLSPAGTRAAGTAGGEQVTEGQGCSLIFTVRFLPLLNVVQCVTG